MLVLAMLVNAIETRLTLTALPQFPLNFPNVCGTLGFQMLLSGPSEELLFRALPIIVLTYFTKSELQTGSVRISAAILIAAVLFAVAHIRWSLSPFGISADFMQILQLFVFGIAYGKAYEKSGSLLDPALIHSIRTVVMVGMGYIVMVMI